MHGRLKQVKKNVTASVSMLTTVILNRINRKISSTESAENWDY